MIPSSIIHYLAAKERFWPLCQVLLASLLISLFAQIRIPLPFTPVPLTLQTLGLFLVSSTLGGKKGAYAASLYLLQGLLGAPVFAGGQSDPLRILGPVGGYLMAYPLQSYLIGLSCEKVQSPLRLLLLFTFSIFLQLSLGSLWLAQFVGIERCLKLGLYPFIAADVSKACLTLFYVKKCNPFSQKNQENYRVSMTALLRSAPLRTVRASFPAYWLEPL